MGCSRRWLMAGFSVVCLGLWSGWCVAAQGPGGPPGGQQRQPGGPPGFGGPGGPGFGGPGFGFGGLTDLLRRDDVRKELELLDDQVQKIEKLNQRRGERMRELFSGMEKVPVEQRFEKGRELMQKEQKQTEKDVAEILLPHQMKRLKQLEVQTRSFGGGQSLLSSRTAEDLGLSADQKEKLRQKATELEEKLRKKTAELRKQNQDELLQLLTPAQQAKWKELVGDPFEFQRTEFRFGGPGGPGGQGPGRPGGPGGDRPQRSR